MNGLANRCARKTIVVTALLVMGSLAPSVSSAFATPATTGQTRVIVTLAVPESAPDASVAIGQTTDALLATLPADDYTVVNRPYVLPFLTLSVGTSAMSVLRSSSLVASLERDGTVSAVSAPRGGNKRKCKTHGTRAKTCKKARKAR